MKIALILAEFNKKIGEKLLAGALRALEEGGVDKKNIRVFRVPGAFEIPLMAARIAKNKKFDGAIALGCALKGGTDHYRSVCDGVTYGIQKVSIENRFPIMFGVLMCRTTQQALARSGEGSTNKGYECGKSLLILLRN